jgi:hypothetical protein
MVGAVKLMDSGSRSALASEPRNELGGAPFTSPGRWFRNGVGSESKAVQCEYLSSTRAHRPASPRHQHQYSD